MSQTTARPSAAARTVRSTATRPTSRTRQASADSEIQPDPLPSLSDFLGGSHFDLKDEWSHRGVKQRPTLSLIAALVAGACIGAGGGAATYAALSSGNGKTVVRQVTVSDSQPAASTSGLSIHAIYELARRGV